MGNSAKLLLHYIHKRRDDVKKSAGMNPGTLYPGNYFRAMITLKPHQIC